MSSSSSSDTWKNTFTKIVSYGYGFFDGVEAVGQKRVIDWTKVAGAAAIGAGALALGTISLLHFYSPFPRGLRRRQANSKPFDEKYNVPTAVANQFYSPEDYQFIRLSQGHVRYILRGKITPSTRVIVLVHGFSIAADIWKQQSDYLAAQGYTVLSFDNYGRGWSDAPDQVLDEHIYVGQLAELLFALRVTQPIDLCGVSMGGAIVASFTARYPQAVARLCMVCPAGLPINTPAAMAASLKRPIIGPATFKALIPHMQERGAPAQWEHKGSDSYNAWAEFAKQNIAHHDGFVRTLYRTVVEYPMLDQRHNYTMLAQQKDLKILIIWGEKDALTPYSNGAILQSLLPGSQLVTVIDAKHNFLIERPQPINEILHAWLQDSNKQLPLRVKESIHETATE